MLDSTLSAKQNVFKKIFKADITSVVGVLIIIIAVMSALRPQFLTMDNFNVIAQAFSITAIVGMSQMIIIGTGGMNLAVGAIGGLTGVITGGAMAVFGLPIWLGILVGITAGGVCGIINGYLITRGGSTGAAQFLVTLATGSVFTGITLGITKANPIYNLPTGFTQFGAANFLGLPLIMYAMLVIAFFLWLLFKYTGLGRRILCLGSNMQAAQLYGVSIKKTVIIAHALSGIVSACAAILLVSRIGSAQTDIGSDWMMFSFAAPIIGGTRQAGGKVNVPGAILGAIVLSSISNALVHLNLNVYWMTFIQGCIIIFAVALDGFRYVRKRNRGIAK